MKTALPFFSSIACLVLAAGCGPRSEPITNNQVVQRQIESQDPSRPLPDRIKEREGLIDELQGRKSKEEENTRLAALYKQLADKQAAEGRPIEAEACLDRARELDPKNPVFCGSLGKLFADQAARAGDPDSRIGFWMRACMNLKDAAKLETDEAKRTEYDIEAATAMYGYAGVLASAGRKLDALEQLYDARHLAPPGSDIYNAVQQMLTEMDR